MQLAGWAVFRPIDRALHIQRCRHGGKNRTKKKKKKKKIRGSLLELEGDCKNRDKNKNTTKKRGYEIKQGWFRRLEGYLDQKTSGDKIWLSWFGIGTMKRF